MSSDPERTYTSEEEEEEEGLNDVTQWTVEPWWRAELKEEDLGMELSEESADSGERLTLSFGKGQLSLLSPLTSLLKSTHTSVQTPSTNFISNGFLLSFPGSDVSSVVYEVSKF